MAVLNGRRRRGEAGSGMVIGVAVIFPMLMLVVVALQMLSDSARVEQAIQSSADRAARAASLCCYHTGGPDGALAVAEASLSASAGADFHNRVHCNNDVVAGSRIVFIDVDGRAVPSDPDANGAYRAVPPGGTVHVLVSCRLPPVVLGGFGIPGLDVTHRAEGVATIDPYRYRAGA